MANGKNDVATDAWKKEMAKKNERSGSSTWKGNDAETSSPERRDNTSEPLYVYSTANWNGAPNNESYNKFNAESDKKDPLWGPQEIWEKNADSASVVQKMDDDEGALSGNTNCSASSKKPKRRA